MDLLELKLPYDPLSVSVRRVGWLVVRSVGWLVGWLVCHDFLKGQDVSLPYTPMGAFVFF